MNEVRKHVAKNPGASIRDVVDGIKHHYQTDATARSSIAKWIEAGKVKGVELRRTGNVAALYPTHTPDPIDDVYVAPSRG
jgi:hypothetical protein